MEAHAPPVTTFKALGDNTRHLIMQILSHRELAVHELVEALDLPQSTVSRHLRILRDAHLLEDRREGATVYCRASSRLEGADPMTQSICEGFRAQPLASEIASRLEWVLRKRRQRSSEFFREKGGEWDDLRLDFFGERFPFEAALGLLPREWTVADLGTGTGYLLPSLANAFANVLAVDHSEEMLAEAKQRVHEAGIGNVDLRHGELEDLPIESERIDLAIAVLVLHHVAEPDKAVQEIARVLAPSGRFLVVELQEHQNEEIRRSMGDLWLGFAPERLTALAVAAGLCRLRVMKLTHPDDAGNGPSGKPVLFATVFQKGQGADASVPPTRN